MRNTQKEAAEVTYPTPAEVGHAHAAVAGIHNAVYQHIIGNSNIDRDRAFRAGLMAQYAAKASLAGTEFSLPNLHTPKPAITSNEFFDAIAHVELTEGCATSSIRMRTARIKELIITHLINGAAFGIEARSTASGTWLSYISLTRESLEKLRDTINAVLEVTNG